MLAVFEKATGKPPVELGLPSMGSENSKTPREILENFLSARSDYALYNLPHGNFMALSHQEENPTHPRSIVVMDDIFCIFVGALANVSDLRHYYGLPRQATEAMIVIEAYKVLRDRAPYPPDQVVKELDGKFAFIMFDARTHTLFAARESSHELLLIWSSPNSFLEVDFDREGSINFFWGMAKDGSLVCSDDPNIIKQGCGKSSSPFPPGCIFMNGSGLTSYDHPLNKVRAIAQEDEKGNISSVYFQVDLFSRIPSIPRTGSASNWADTATID